MIHEALMWNILVFRLKFIATELYRIYESQILPDFIF